MLAVHPQESCRWGGGGRWDGSINGQLGKPSAGRLCKDHLSVDPEGDQLIGSQLGKDPQRLCKDHLRQC